MGDSLSGLSLEALGGAYSKYSGKTVSTVSEDETGYLDFDSYLKLLVSKMQNQDFNDPMSDTEVLSQMSQYSMLEGIKNMTAQSNISYASSLVGKAVTVNDGTNYDTGVVDSIIVENSTPYLIVNGSRYGVETISDISSQDMYNKLSSLLGHTVEAKTANEDGTETTTEGKVTNILILGGEGYVILDGEKVFSLSDIKVKAAEGSEGTEENSDNVTAYGNVEDTQVQAGYAAQSAALFDDLMSTIDAISNNTSVEAAADEEPELVPNLEGYEVVTVRNLEIPEYAAGVFASTDETLETLSRNADSVETYSYNAETSNTIGLQNGAFDQVLTASNLYTLAAAESDERISSTLTNEEVYRLLVSGEYETRYSTRYGLEVYSDSKPGISNSDCVPHRHQADLYPAEAALADALGTRMYDIKYIHNNAITSRIDTSRVIGRTLTGREVTEIGFSGVGMLGEVVTFKDGTQRVEIMLKNGHSCWLETSGNYTLDEICNFDVAPGTYAGKFTPFEKAIRNYSRELTENDYASMNDFISKLQAMGVTVE